MPKINFSAPLKTLSGVAFKVKEGGGERDMTLGDTAIEGLLASTREESSVDKFKAGLLAEKIYKGGNIELTPEEIVLVKDKIGAAYGANVVLPAFKILNG